MDGSFGGSRTNHLVGRFGMELYVSIGLTISWEFGRCSILRFWQRHKPSVLQGNGAQTVKGTILTRFLMFQFLSFGRFPVSIGTQCFFSHSWYAISVRVARGSRRI